MDASATSPALATRSASTTFAQLLRFAFVGVGVNAALFVVYLALVGLGLGPKLAMTSVFAAGVALGFALHRRWTFASHGAAHREWLPYSTVCAAGYLLNLAALALCVDRLGWPHAWVQGAMLFIVAGATFVLNRAWVFRVRSS